MFPKGYSVKEGWIISQEARQEHDDLCWLLLRRWPLPEPRPSVEKVRENCWGLRIHLHYPLLSTGRAGTHIILEGMGSNLSLQYMVSGPI